jgi:hypothetical protein
MRRTRAPSRPPLINAALIVLAILVAIYVPLRISLERARRAQMAPARGSSVSIFVTNRLAGYREPCG